MLVDLNKNYSSYIRVKCYAVENAREQRKENVFKCLLKNEEKGTKISLPNTGLKSADIFFKWGLNTSRQSSAPRRETNPRLLAYNPEHPMGPLASDDLRGDHRGDGRRRIASDLDLSRHLAPGARETPHQCTPVITA